ncbi:proline-rich protein 15-like protein-like [Arapaima gigas]
MKDSVEVPCCAAFLVYLAAEGMAEKGSWWRLASKKKSSTGSREATVTQQQAPEPESKDAVVKASKPSKELRLDPQQGEKCSSKQTNEESQGEPMFIEKSSRRNLKVSRSGRFKEKRRVRATIPEHYETETPPAREDLR